MPNIKEIALKAGLANFDNYQDDGKTLMVAGFDVTDQVIRTVESAVAELAKGNEPVGSIQNGKFQWNTDGGPEKWRARKDFEGNLYTLPPTASQIEQETAEACAKLSSLYEDSGMNCFHTKSVAKAIRSGAWKEYK